MGRKKLLFLFPGDRDDAEDRRCKGGRGDLICCKAEYSATSHDKRGGGAFSFMGKVKKQSLMNTEEEVESEQEMEREIGRERRWGRVEKKEVGRSGGRRKRIKRWGGVEKK